MVLTRYKNKRFVTADIVTKTRALNELLSTLNRLLLRKEVAPVYRIALGSTNTEACIACNGRLLAIFIANFRTGIYYLLERYMCILFVYIYVLNCVI